MNKKKKILFVSASLGLGGSERCMAEMIRHIDLERYDITVLALMPVENMQKFDPQIRVIEGISEFERFNMPMSVFVPQAIKKGKFNPLAWKSVYWVRTKIGKKHLSQYFWQSLSRYIPKTEENFDVVVGYGQGPATYYAIDKVPNAKKKILWLNTDLEKAKYDTDYVRRFYVSADVVAADSENGKKNLLRLYPELEGRVYSYPNMLDVDGIVKKAEEYAAVYPENGIKRILTVGRMAEAKALHLAVGAAEILKKRCIPFKWYIIGDGSLRGQIEEQIHRLGVEDCLVLLGTQTNPYPWFEGCDIYVQTSIYEGSCMTINEAMIFNKPVVTTNFPAAYEKIEDGRNGFICKMNAQSIADKVEQLLNDKALCQKMSDYTCHNQSKWESDIQQFYDMLENH